jgi:hypothetical protein
VTRWWPYLYPSPVNSVINTNKAGYKQHSKQSASQPYITNTSSYVILVKTSKHLLYTNRSSRRQNTPLMVGLYEDPSKNNFNVRAYNYIALRHTKNKTNHLFMNLFILVYLFRGKVSSSLYSRIQLFVTKRDRQKSHCITGIPAAGGPYTAWLGGRSV